MEGNKKETEESRQAEKGKSKRLTHGAGWGCVREGGREGPGVGVGDGGSGERRDDVMDERRRGGGGGEAVGLAE